MDLFIGVKTRKVKGNQVAYDGRVYSRMGWKVAETKPLCPKATCVESIVSASVQISFLYMIVSNDDTVKPGPTKNGLI